MMHIMVNHRKYNIYSLDLHMGIENAHSYLYDYAGIIVRIIDDQFCKNNNRKVAGIILE